MARNNRMSMINMLKDLQTCAVHGLVRDWKRHKVSGSEESREAVDSGLEHLEKIHTELFDACMAYGRSVVYGEEVCWRRTEGPADPKKQKEN